MFDSFKEYLDAAKNLQEKTNSLVDWLEVVAQDELSDPDFDAIETSFASRFVRVPFEKAQARMGFGMIGDIKSISEDE